MTSSMISTNLNHIQANTNTTNTTTPTTINTSPLAGGGGISFDDFSKIRILHPTYFESSEKLKDDVHLFNKSMAHVTLVVMVM